MWIGGYSALCLCEGLMAGSPVLSHILLYSPNNRWQPLQQVPLPAEGQREVSHLAALPKAPCFRVGRNCLALVGEDIWLEQQPFNVGVPGIFCIGPLLVYQVPDSLLPRGCVLARRNLNYRSSGKFMYFPGGHLWKDQDIRRVMHLILKLLISC